MKYIGLIAISFILLISGCVQNQNSYVQQCVQKCQSELSKGTDLSSGPCILDPIPDSTWVCDVAHTPRQSVDDLIINQCSSFNSGRANNFIEVTPGCDLIRTG